MLSIFAVIAFGVIIITVAVLAYLAGKRTRKSALVTDEKGKSLSLQGLSPRSIEIMKQTYDRVWIWEENRGPNKRLYRKIHTD